MTTAEATEPKIAEDWEKRLRLKTGEVCKILSCSDEHLRDWEKVCPRLFAPVCRQKNGNIYRPQQVKIMADVMDRLMNPETGVELWERTQSVNTDDMYRDAGDKTRGVRK